MNTVPSLKREIVGWVIYFFFSCQIERRASRRSLNSPLSFQLCATLSFFSLLIQSSMSHRQHLGSRPGRATWLDIYTHTIPSEREAWPAVNKLGLSSINNNIAKKYLNWSHFCLVLLSFLQTDRNSSLTIWVKKKSWIKEKSLELIGWSWHVCRSDRVSLVVVVVKPQKKSRRSRRGCSRAQRMMRERIRRTTHTHGRPNRKKRYRLLYIRLYKMYRVKEDSSSGS
jgi:hypothetical protein